MPSPESSSPPPDASSTGTGAPESFLDTTRRELVDQGTEDRLSNRSERDLSHPSYVEQVYSREETDRIIESVRTDIGSESRVTKNELIHRAAERMIAGRMHLARADADAHEEALETKGKGWFSKLMTRYRHSTKARLGIAAVSLAGAAALAASGLWMPAVGVKLASGGLRAAATYFGAKEGMEAYGQNRLQRGEKKGKRLRPGHEAGQLHIPEAEPADMLDSARELVRDNPNEAIKRLVMFESPQVKAHRPPEQQGRADAWMAALYQAELERVEADYRAVLTQTDSEGKKLYFKKDLPDRLRGLVAASLNESLAMRREQIATEQATRSKQTKIAAALAAVAGLSGVVGWLTHAAEHGSTVAGHAHKAAGHARHAAGKVLDHKGAPGAHAHELHTPVHEHDFSYEASHGGDSFWTAGEAAVNHATKVMPEAHDMGHARRLIANDYLKDWLLQQHHGDSLVLKGEHIKIPHEVLKNAIVYAKNYKI